MKSGFELVDVRLDDGGFARGLQRSVPLPGADSQSPIVVDFQSPKLLHRIKNGVGSELIVKAVGLAMKDRAGAVIYDFTAGLGTDSFLLAQAGFRVIGFERDKMVFEILQDGLKRFRSAVDIKNLAGPELDLEFRNDDVIEAVGPDLSNPLLPKAYAVIVDPMFESTATATKSLPKKEMAVLREMLPSSSAVELQSLFEAARAVATSRVIVKRPVGSSEIVDTFTRGGREHKLTPRRLEGKTARFDIYSCR